MLELFLIGYICGVVTLIFLAEIDARKKRPHKNPGTELSVCMDQEPGLKKTSKASNDTIKIIILCSKKY